MASAANAILASSVEMFKARVKGQYGNPSDKCYKWLHVVEREIWME
jgi:solute carrier family 25 carnitine/acylcarnitine transporter 20/29